ncbi:hypothetical protein EJ02DRAFT_352000 [Clathrospora elynae]|uniref:Uncharacterized protein n=1 Tax=Clathrospora elynae TaxID=706981 RepID=A0A6A5SIX9_9PLEO|nr:hypothetical protein EJ02DRAFT_352000 [Clathrospora elynae]
MAIDSSVVPKLAKDGANSYQWETAFKLYAQAHGYDSILNGTWVRLLAMRGNLHNEPTTISIAFPDQTVLRAAQERVRKDNATIEAQYVHNYQ